MNKIHFEAIFTGNYLSSLVTPAGFKPTTF